MQIESTGNGYKVWLTPDEYERLRDYAANRPIDEPDKSSPKHHAVVLLGGKVGLRAQEIAEMRYGHVRKDDEGYYRLRVPESAGKDTTGGGGKARDAWIPTDVERDLLEIRFELERDEDERLLGVEKSRVRQIVRDLGEEMAEETGNTDWGRLSSHDLRRFFAQSLLVRENANIHTVMAVGGWSSPDALAPYLAKPTEQQIRDEMVAAGWD